VQKIVRPFGLAPYIFIQDMKPVGVCILVLEVERLVLPMAHGRRWTMERGVRRTGQHHDNSAWHTNGVAGGTPEKIGHAVCVGLRERLLKAEKLKSGCQAWFEGFMSVCEQRALKLGRELDGIPYLVGSGTGRKGKLGTKVKEETSWLVHQLTAYRYLSTSADGRSLCVSNKRRYSGRRRLCLIWMGSMRGTI